MGRSIVNDLSQNDLSRTKKKEEGKCIGIQRVVIIVAFGEKVGRGGGGGWNSNLRLIVPHCYWTQRSIDSKSISPQYPGKKCWHLPNISG